MTARTHAMGSGSGTPPVKARIGKPVTNKAATKAKRAASTAQKHATFDKVVRVIGYVASVLSVIMYVSYVPQIADNLAGHPGNPIQPFAAMLNCIMWSAYGLLKEHRDWPIVIANVPGVFLAATAFATAIMEA